MTARTTFTYANIVWRGLRKSTKIIFHDGRYQGRHLKAGPPEQLSCFTIYHF
jgi:hypothetical protein